MLTRLIERTEAVAEDRIEYEYEYRDAEYEYELNPVNLTNNPMHVSGGKRAN
jgi:hypothetical protein